MVHTDRGLALCQECQAREMPGVLWRAAGVPEGYGHASVGSYRAETAAEREAVRRVVQWVRGWQPGMAGVYLTGQPGRGKSHLAAGIARGLSMERWRDGLWPAWCPVTWWLESLKAAFGQPDEYEALVAAACEAPVLILDDLAATAGLREWGNGTLLMLLEERMARRRPVVVTCNAPMAGLEGLLDDRIVSRLRLACLPELVLDGPDRRAAGQTWATLDGRAA